MKFLGLRSKQVSAIVIALLMLLSIATIFMPQIPQVAASSSITLVQGPAKGTASTANGTFTVTLSKAPTSGDVLILVFTGTGGTADPSASSISQTGVTWSKAIAENNSATLDTEIWYGIVGANAGTTITVTVSGGTGGTYGEAVDVCEWSGLSAYPLDQTATNAGTEGSTTNTGTTNTTTQTAELWIGATGGRGTTRVSQSTPTNSFTLLDGAAGASSNNYVSLAYLYKVVSTTGAASSGTTASSSTFYWSGCIATFSSTSTITAPSNIGVYVTKQCASYPVTISTQWMVMQEHFKQLLFIGIKQGLLQLSLLQ